MLITLTLNSLKRVKKWVLIYVPNTRGDFHTLWWDVARIFPITTFGATPQSFGRKARRYFTLCLCFFFLFSRGVSWFLFCCHPQDFCGNLARWNITRPWGITFFSVCLQTVWVLRVYFLWSRGVERGFFSCRSLGWLHLICKFIEPVCTRAQWG